MSSEAISPSNFPPLSASARFSTSTRRVRGSSPAVISCGRSMISPTPTMTGMRSSETGEVEVVMVSCFHFPSNHFAADIVFLRHCEPTGRREAPPDDRLGETIHKGAARVDCFVAALLAMTGLSRLLRHQRVHMLRRLDKIFLEFLHHGAGGFHAVDQSNALSDKIADEIARLLVAGCRRAIDGVEGVAADDALQRHRQRAGAVGPAIPRIGPDRTQLPRRLSGAAL